MNDAAAGAIRNQKMNGKCTTHGDESGIAYFFNWGAIASFGTRLSRKVPPIRVARQTTIHHPTSEQLDYGLFVSLGRVAFYRFFGSTTEYKSVTFASVLIDGCCKTIKEFPWARNHRKKTAKRRQESPSRKSELIRPRRRLRKTV